MKASLSHIREAERAVGAQFPQGYVDWCLQANVGRTQVAGRVFSLFGVLVSDSRQAVRKTFNSVVEATRDASQWAQWPKGAICIGADGSGDRLFLTTTRRLLRATKVEPAIYMWWHENGAVARAASDFGQLEML